MKFSDHQSARILLIAVHYRSGLSMAAFLDSLQCGARFEDIAEVVVVDNASGIEHLSELRRVVERAPNIQLLESPKNCGYFGAANFAVDNYLARRHKLPDWIIVCNHDVLIQDSEFFSRLLSMDPMAASVIAPRIQIIPTGADQNPFMLLRPRRWHWTALRLLASFYGLATLWDWLSRHKLRLKGLSGRTINPMSRKIYAAHGSFLIFSRRYFEAGGFLDGNLFLYGEEISVAEICRSLGLRLLYEPSLRVLHNEHKSTGKTLSRFTYECQKQAFRYVTSRYFSGAQYPNNP